MLQLTPKKLEEIDFSAYGRVYRLGKTGAAAFTDANLMLRAYKLGATHSGSGRFICSAMERHVSTEEILFAGDSALALCLSDDDPYSPPHACNLLCVVLEPGDVVVLNKGVWHDACRGLDGRDTLYYFMALNNGEPSELEWTKVQPEGVEVLSDCSAAAYSKTKHGAREKAVSSLFCRNSIFAEGLVSGAEWECWQTENVCPGFPVRLGFIPICGGKAVELRAGKAGEEFLLCVDAPMELNFEDGSNTDLLPGEYISVRPGTAYSASSATDTWCYLMVR